MKHTFAVSMRAMLAIATMFIVSLIVPGMTSAQVVVGGGDDPQPTAYDISVNSGADGRAGEFPLTYTVNYDNGTSQDITVGGEGNLESVSPAGVSNVVSIAIGGTVVVAANDIFCFPRDANGGCWCLCLKWLRHKWFPWIVRPVFVWYYDPCCNR